MRLCTITEKECWRDDHGSWYSSGGFPRQIDGIHALFSEHEIVIVGKREVGQGTPLLPFATVVPMRAAAGRRLTMAMSFLWHLPANMLRMIPPIRRADVLHVACPGYLDVVALLFAIVSRKRTIVRYVAAWDNPCLVARVTRWLLLHAVGPANIVILVGEGDDPPRPSFHYLFSTAFDNRMVLSITPNQSTTRQEPARLVFVGRLSREKGVDVLVEAMRQLRSRLQRNGAGWSMPHLDLFGDGSQRTTLEAQVKRLALDDAISFQGQQPHARILQELQSADLLVLPSFTEGFPKARLDAMLCGVPVVTTDVGFARAMCGEPGERGWVVPVGDARALADRIAEIFADSGIDWKALRQRCREYAAGRTVEAYTARLAAICCAKWNMRSVNGKLVE